MAYKKDEILKIFDTVCERIENGEAVRTILREDAMPSSRTFFKWLEQDEQKVKQYARAREIYADAMFEDVILISDGSGNDVLIDEDGIENINHHAIQRDRLRTDTRKWALSKLNPKKYGDKMNIDHTTKGNSFVPDLTKEEKEALKDELNKDY